MSSNAGLSEETVLDVLRLVTLLEGMQGGGTTEDASEDCGEIKIYTKDAHGASVELDLVVGDLPFAFQVLRMGHARRKERDRSNAERLKTHCVECGCLKENGHLPDCGTSFYPEALTLGKKEEPGIAKKIDPLDELRQKFLRDR